MISSSKSREARYCYARLREFELLEGVSDESRWEKMDIRDGVW